MSFFQFLMFLIAGYFALKIYEHIQTLKDPQEKQPPQPKEKIKRDMLESVFSFEELVQKADEAFEKGDEQKALFLLQEAKRKKVDEEVLFKIGYLLDKQGKESEAMFYYQEALKIKEEYFIHNAIASLYRKQKVYDKAKEHLEKSLELDENNAVTYYNYGNLLVDMDEKEKAKQMYQKALELDKTLTNAKVELQRLENE